MVGAGIGLCFLLEKVRRCIFLTSCVEEEVLTHVKDNLDGEFYSTVTFRRTAAAKPCG